MWSGFLSGGRSSTPAATPRTDAEPALYTWERGTRVSTARDGLVPPPRAVKASDRMYVIRSVPQGDIGKYIMDECKAVIPLKGKEQRPGDFEFLVLGPQAVASWHIVYSPPGPKSEPLVWASPRMAVIRATTYRDRDPGKWIADENKPVIPHCGKEVRLKEGTFEFLIVRSAVDPRSGGSAAPPSLDPAYSGAVAGTPVGQTERAKHLLEESLYSWHPAQGADGGIWVPHGALKTSERMFVVRTPEGEVGKFIADEGVAKFPLKGKEITVDKDKFDFLVVSRLAGRMIKMPRNLTGFRAVGGGRTRSLHLSHVARDLRGELPSRLLTPIARVRHASDSLITSWALIRDMSGLPSDLTARRRPQASACGLPAEWRSSARLSIQTATRANSLSMRARQPSVAATRRSSSGKASMNFSACAAALVAAAAAAEVAALPRPRMPQWSSVGRSCMLWGRRRRQWPPRPRPLPGSPHSSTRPMWRSTDRLTATHRSSHMRGSLSKKGGFPLSICILAPHPPTTVCS